LKAKICKVIAFGMKRLETPVSNHVIYYVLHYVLYYVIVILPYYSTSPLQTRLLEPM